MNVVPNAFALPGEPHTSRIGIFLLAYAGLGGLLQLDGTFALKMTGFPKGAKLLFIEADNQRNMLRLYVEHESMPETFEGCQLPEMPCITADRFEGAFAPREVS